MLKIIHCVDFGGGEVILPKGFFPPTYLCGYVLFLYLVFVFMVDYNIIVYIILNL